MDQMQVKDFAVRLEKISRSFGTTAAISNVSLDIRRGDVVSLVGHSGCGKSTLLRIISGVETVDTGRVILDGREVDGQAFIEPEARGIGFVFQDYALFPHLTVRENVLFGLKRRPRAEVMARAAEMLGRVGIAHMADRYPHTLSGGEQQRVALARALAPRPAIVLMDEPFSNLDQGLRERVRSETRSLLKSLDSTVIIVTHDPQEALAAGDRVALMHAGQIVQIGSAYDLHDRPANAYAAEFFGTFTKIRGVWNGDRLETPIGNFTGRKGSGETVYVRPQAISVSLDRGDFTARIEERVFRGETEQVRLRVDGLEDTLKATLIERLPEGVETVKISIASDRVLIL